MKLIRIRGGAATRTPLGVARVLVVLALAGGILAACGSDDDDGDGDGPEGPKRSAPAPGYAPGDAPPMPPTPPGAGPPDASRIPDPKESMPDAGGDDAGDDDPDAGGDDAGGDDASGGGDP